MFWPLPPLRIGLISVALSVLLWSKALVLDLEMLPGPIFVQLGPTSQNVLKTIVRHLVDTFQSRSRYISGFSFSFFTGGDSMGRVLSQERVNPSLLWD